MPACCIIKNCPYSHMSKKINIQKPHLLSFFQPRTQTRLQRWRQSLGINLKVKDYVCQFHFKEEHLRIYDKITVGNVVHYNYLQRKVLKEEALPTIEHQLVVDPEVLYQNQLFVSIEQPEQLQNHAEKQQQIENDIKKEQLTLIKVEQQDCEMKLQPLHTNALPNHKNHAEKQQQIQNDIKKEQLTLISVEQQDCEMKLQPLPTNGSQRIEISKQIEVQGQDQAHCLGQQQIQNSLDKDNQQIQELSQCFDSLQTYVKNYSILPAKWCYLPIEKGLEFCRINSTSSQIMNHIILNKDLSITVICPNKREVNLGHAVTLSNGIYNFLKTVEKWPICVGTQVDKTMYSKHCKGVIIGSESYKRLQRNPRCLSCRILRNQLLPTINTYNNSEKRRAYKRRAEHTMKNCKLLKIDDMVVYCILCGSRREKCISYHRFPQDVTIREKWLQFCGMKEHHLKSVSSICSRHFRMNDFVKDLNRSTLKLSSIPTIYSTESADEILDTENTEQSPHNKPPQMFWEKSSSPEYTTDVDKDSFVDDNYVMETSITADEDEDITLVNKSDLNERNPSLQDLLVKNFKPEYTIDIDNYTLVESESAVKLRISPKENQEVAMENTSDFDKQNPHTKSSNILLFKSGKQEYTIDVDEYIFGEDDDEVEPSNSAEESPDIGVVNTSSDTPLDESSQQEYAIDVDDDTLVEGSDANEPDEGEPAVAAADLDINSFRYGVPRYIGDIQMHHLATPRRAEYTLSIVKKTFENQRKKIKTLQRGNRLLRDRISYMKGLVKYLKRKKFVTHKDVLNYRNTCGKQIEEHSEEEEDIFEK